MISVSTFALKLLSSHIMLLIILKAKRKSWPWFVHTNWAVYVTYQYQTFLHLSLFHTNIFKFSMFYTLKRLFDFQSYLISSYIMKQCTTNYYYWYINYQPQWFSFLYYFLFIDSRPWQNVVTLTQQTTELEGAGKFFAIFGWWTMIDITGENQ